jgi:hypothetical protein
MSDVVRSYSGTLARSGSRRRRRRGSGVSWLLTFLVFLLILGWMMWTSRDSYPLERMVPQKQAYYLYVADFLGRRETVAESGVWDLFPEGHGIRKFQGQLKENFDLPSWVANNVAYGPIVVSGNDLETFSDPLLATKMSRTACILEKLRYFFPDVEEDLAGGLSIQSVENGAFYYAVRGRILLASLSRSALVSALTLSESDALETEHIAQRLSQDTASDVLWDMWFPEETGAGYAFDEGHVALNLRQDSLGVSATVHLRPSWQEHFTALMNNASPTNLPAPAPGPIALSVNFGIPLNQLWNGLDQALGETVDLSASALWLQSSVAGDSDTLNSFLAAAPALLGPGIGLTVNGIDDNAMVPMPELTAIVEADTATLEAAMDTLPLPTGDQPALLAYRADDRMLWVPMVGGPSLEPTAVLVGDKVLLSSSHSVATALLDENFSPDDLPEKGNLYVSVDPNTALLEFKKAALPFLELGLLRDYSMESFEAAVGPWTEVTAKIDHLSLYAGHDKGIIQVQAALQLAP